MNKSDDAQKKAARLSVPSGNEESPRTSRAVASLPRAKTIASYTARTMPSPAALPQESPKKANKAKVSYKESIGDAIPAQDKDELVCSTNNHNEEVAPPYDEEAGIRDGSRKARSRITSVEQVATDMGHQTNANNLGSCDITAPVEVVRPAVLVLDPEEARREMLAHAVSATNVHAVSTRRHDGKHKWKMPLVLLFVVILAIVGISLGTVLGRRETPRFDQVTALVEMLFETTLQDPSSPRYQAAQWMANEDVAFKNLATVDLERFRQRYVLALFYYATGGPTSWNDTSFFLLPDIHECDWHTPNYTWSWSGFIGAFNCSSKQRVRRIEITENNLTGTLPPELGTMTLLTELTVVNNSIGGTVPPSIFSLSDLGDFDIWFNDFTGTIPTEIGRATALYSLDMANNSLTGTIPTEVGNLASLQDFLVDGNFLTGSIPDTLLQLSNARVILLHRNQLTGTIPDNFDSLSLLKVAKLSANKFTGQFPSSIAALTNIEMFLVWENQLTGTIPDNFGSLSRLDLLDLSENNFTGPIPSSITALANATYIDVGINNLTGTLPDNWEGLSRTLEWFGADANHLDGTLPESLGNLSALNELYLHDNSFHGTLPASLGNLMQLEHLWLGKNRFMGTVPMTFAQLSLLSVSLPRI